MIAMRETLETPTKQAVSASFIGVFAKAGEGDRTLDIQLGRLTLYR
jgi:hypothetical protein